MKVVLLDNYDSFTFNLSQALEELGAEVVTVRNDQVTMRELSRMEPTHLVISPGPGVPEDAGITLEAIREFVGKVPILGVCLGHQALGMAFGAALVRCPYPVHGKTSAILHDGKTIYSGMPNPFIATRYHSLMLSPRLPSCLEASAWTEDGLIMGIRHREYPAEGVQFHPESFLTERGKTVLKNFLELEV
ncbi:MAG: aminodeoxychorismate/anthranilate synthase component II [Candidatus Geothermincolales bacterium]